MKTNYEQQANEFLQKTNTTVKIDFLKYDFHFQDDKERRDIYIVTIKRGSRQFSFNFGNSLNNTSKNQAPTNYDILACLQKYDVGSFYEFCGDFGYNEDSRKAQKIYHAVCKEYDNVCKIWNDSEIELLSEIN
jgi:hypothetical protein